MKMKHMHIQDNGLSPTASFLLDGKLIGFELITPAYNDYGEWRLTFDFVAVSDYRPEENTIELNPLKDFDDVELTDENLVLINDMSTLLNDEEKDCEGIIEKYKTNSYEDFSEYEEMVGGFDKGEFYLTIDGKWMKYSDWEDKEDKLIFHKFMAPLLKTIVEKFKNR